MKVSMKGFTLIELLVVIALIAILSSVVFTGLSSKCKGGTLKPCGTQGPVINESAGSEVLR